MTVTPLNSLAAIPTDLIHPNPRNIRRTGLGNLDDLTASIRADGILQPLLVEANPAVLDSYLLIAGHRRLAAAKRAGLMKVPCIVRAQAGARTTSRMLIENLQRADLHPLDEAKAYQDLLDAAWSRGQIAKMTGLPLSRINGRLDLLHLPAPVQKMVRAGDVTLGQASDLAKQVKATKTGIITPRSEKVRPHFTEAHRLSRAAKAACDFAAHATSGRLGGIACGTCWEDVIRLDERRAQP